MKGEVVIWDKKKKDMQRNATVCLNILSLGQVGRAQVVSNQRPAQLPNPP